VLTGFEVFGDPESRGDFGRKAKSHEEFAALGKDHIGPVDLPKGLPREADVRPHPHIGLSTVTYLFVGEIMHRDSIGVEQAIRPGEMNWMIAGSGITHSERFERARREGGRIHAIQSWVALPDGEEEVAPAFAHHEGKDPPVHDDDGIWLRLLAGEAFGIRAAMRTHSPLFYAHVVLQSGARIALPGNYAERSPTKDNCVISAMNPSL
jgi:redox-sensitive bicupin YhaK (pirin superfamily)